MVPRVARSGSSSTLFGKTKSNEGEKPSGRRKGMVSCPPIPRPISDKRDKREKKRIFPKVYIFRFFRASRRSRPSPSFLLILSKKFMKEIPGNITFLSQIDRSRWEKSCVVFYSLILILCSSKNQYSGYVGGGSLPLLTLDAALNVSADVSLCVRTVNVTLPLFPENHPLFCSANYFPVADTPRASKRLCQGSETA